MANLTTSWQNLGHATLKGSIVIYLQGRYTSQSITDNTSVVQFRLKNTGTYWRTTSGTAKFTGAYTDSESCATYPSYIDDGDIIFSIEKTVIHNTNGTKSFSIGGQVKAALDATYTATISNVSVTLPTINRLATILTAEDFTDEGNPTITFNNPSNFTVKPYLNFYNSANTLVHQITRNESITTPYTWNITAEERTALRNATNQQASYRVQIGVDTYNGATKLGYNSVPKTMTYVNATPTQTIAVEETNANVISVLGNDSSATYVIQNASSLHFSSTPTTLKGATVNNVALYQNGVLQQAITTTPYSFTNILAVSDTFNIVITDSRSLSTNTEKKYTTTYIEYLPIDITTFSFVRPSPTSNNIILNAEITYKQTTFKNTVNVPTIKWKTGEEGTLNTLSSNDYTIDTANNKITITDLTLTNALAYNTSETMYLYANDLLTEDTDNNIVPKGIPTFDAGEHDFQINGDLYIADTDRDNAVNVGDTLDWLKTQNTLWSGSYYMNAVQSVDLTDTPINSQPHGIVLIWSAYDSNGPEDWDWVCNFIPKSFVDLYGTGNGMAFNMASTTFGNVGAKYIYVSNTSLTGHNNNAATGTNSGITYKNNHWVLRYVIGV